MRNENGKSSPLITSSAIALALAGLAYVLYQPPLESIRPGAADLKGLETRDERVQSHLWQDPFLAVTDHQNGEKKLEDDPNLTVELRAGYPLSIHLKRDKTEEHHQISNLVRTLEKKDPAVVMMVMTNGSNSAEGHETRLRDRNAVLSALGVACFVPSDEEHIYFYNLTIKSNEEAGSNYLKFVPYEYLDRRKLRECNEDGKIFKRALVLWFQEDDLGKHPLKTLREVWAQIIEELKEKPKPDLVILGPRSSSGLRTMAEEGVLNEDKKQLDPQKNGNSSTFKGVGVNRVNLWSPWATVDDELLVYSLRESMEKDCLPQGQEKALKMASKCVSEIFENNGVNLFRTIPSDKKLVEALLQELRGRYKIENRPDRNNKDPHKNGKIAIVSEWDTFYGRSLPLEFRRTIYSQGEEKKGEKKCAKSMNALEHFVKCPEEDEWSGVFRYSYLRGLDGKVPSRDQEQTNKKGKDTKAPTVKEAIRSIGLGEMERPVGESQLDYTRRLAIIIREKDEREKDKCGVWERFFHNCGGIEAIGVTGSDVYDKLLVLQALRQRLPDKVFFTTDLDDRYVDPEQIKWTRNLIVASHFGLRLEEGIQRDIPPFRESYQTSAYYTVLRALKILDCTDETPAKLCGPSGLRNSLDKSRVYDSEIPVRLYEIGNKEPVAIGLYPEPTDDKEKKPVYDFLPLTLLHEYLKPPFGLTDLELVFKYLVVGGTFGLGLLCLTTPLCPWVKQWAKEDLNLKVGVLFLSLTIGAVTLACWTLLMQGASGEPVAAPTQGISIWPTEGIRLSVVLLTGVILYLAWLRINNPKGIFSKDIFNRLDETQQGSSSSKGEKEVVLIREENSFQENTEQEKVDPKRLWTNYLVVGKFRVRMRRSASMAVLYFFLGVALLIGIDQELPQVPCRGQSACWADHIVTIISVLCLLTLIAFVFDATRLSRLMIENLNTGDTDWASGEPNSKETILSGDRLKAESDWWDVRFVAEHTASITFLVYFPFIALFLMVFARNPIFDAWRYSNGLVILFVLSSSMCLVSTFLLRRAAEKSRERALTNLRGYLASAIGLDKNLEKFIRYRIEEVESIKKGAYAAFLQRPEVQALGLLAATIFHIYLSP